MEWLITAGTVLGSVFGTALVVFRRSLGKAREGGRSAVARVRVEAEQTRARANDRFLDAEVRLPGLRVRVESAFRAGTLRRTAAGILARQQAAQASADRSAQSFTAGVDQHRELLDRLRADGLLGEGAAERTVGAVGPAARAREDVAELGRLLQDLERRRTACEESGLLDPLSVPVAITAQDVEATNARLSRPDRFDETRFRALAHEAALGRDLLTRGPDRRDRADEERDRAAARGPGSGPDPLTGVPTTLREALRRQAEKGTAPRAPRRIDVAEVRRGAGRAPGPKP